MARLSFADLVRSTGVNYQAEYQTLLSLLQGSAYKIFPDDDFKGDILGNEYESRSFKDFCDKHFESFPVSLRGTCRSMGGYNRYHNYYPDGVGVPDLDALLTFSEYVMTFSVALHGAIKRDGYCRHERLVNEHICQHMNILINNLHHKVVLDGPFVRLVPEDVVVAEVASNLPKEVAIKTFLYRHRSMDGNIEKKKEALLSLGHQLESKRNEIHDKGLEGAIFAILNNMNLRHNNVDPNKLAYYREYVAKLDSKELEKWYDNLYQMMLAVFARLDASDALAVFEANKDKLNPQR